MKFKSFIFFCLCFLMLFYGFTNISKSTENLDIKRVKNSLDSALITCYSVEGKYPKSIQYLKKYYGFSYDTDCYSITYDWQGQNLYPNIYVYKRG